MRNTVFFSALMGDSRGYDTWARDIAAGAWIGKDVFYQAPLYPYFLGVIYALTGRDLLIVRVVQALLGAISCVALSYAGARLVSRRAGLVAGLMLAVYPTAIFFDGLIQKSVLDVLFVCVSLALIGGIASGTSRHRDATRGSPRATSDSRPVAGEWLPWLLLGGAMGALSLTRENALVLVAVVAVWAVTHGAGGRISQIADPTSPTRPTRLTRPTRPNWALAPAAMFVAGLAFVLLPVALRNYAVGGGFYLTTSQFGSNLYIGNNPRADGSYVSLRAGRGSPEFERLDATELAEQSMGRRLTPTEVSEYWTDRTLAFIASDPAGWLRLLARKARLLWSATEIIDTESQESHAEYSLPLRLSAVWHFGVVLPLAVIGACVVWRDRQRLWIVYALSAAYAASVVLFFVVARYRYPLVPFVMLFAAAGLAGARDWSWRATRAQITTAAATAAALTIVSNWPLHTAASQQAITENNLGTALQEDGRLEEAVQRYRRALALDPGYTPALNNLGTALRAAGRVEEAVSVYEQAVAKGSTSPSVAYNLGNARLEQGKPAEAIAHFRKALQENPRFVDAQNNLGLALAAEGRLDEAIAAFREAIRIDDRSAQAHGNLGKALATRRAFREAAAHLERAIEITPDNAAAHYDLGSLWLEAGEFAPAVTHLRDAIRLEPANAVAHNNLAVALASQGEIADAVKHWQEALRLKPGFADAQRNLERARGKKN